MKRTFVLAAAAFALGVPAATIGAQTPLSFGVLAGAALPTGDAGDELETGFSLGATLGVTPALLPVGVRIDGVWNSMSYQEHGAGHENEDLAILSLTANALLQIPTGALTGLSPYLIGGIGLYSADDPHLTDRQNEFGWNVGGGLRFQLAGFSTFAEARFNSFDMAGETVSYVPITFGIVF